MYRSAWTWSMALAGGAGVLAAVVEWSLGALPLFLFLAATSFCIRLTLNDEPQLNWRRAARAGVVWGVASLAAFGLVAWLELGGLVLIALLALLSPAALASLGRRVRLRALGQRDAAHAGPASTGDPGRQDRPEPAMASDPSLLQEAWMTQPLASMDDATVCFSWRISFVALQLMLPKERRMELVQRRQELLDELERRNPHGFEAWLASGPRAAGDPTRYLTLGRRQMNRHDQR